MRLRWLPLVPAAWLAALATASCSPPDDAAPAVASDTGATARAAWGGFHVADPDRIPHELATNPGTPWGDHVGSGACATCHPLEHAQWRDSFHSRTLYDARAETVFGDFTGAVVFNDPAHAFVVVPYSEKDPETGRDRFFMRIRLRSPEARSRADTYGNGLPEQVEADVELIYAFGNRRHQPYVARWPDGKHWVVPVFWNDVEDEWRYCGYRPYVESCAGCHVSGIKHADAPFESSQRELPQTYPRKYNLPPDREGWAEGAVGCEVCHGAGRPHVEAVEKVGVETYRRLRREGAKGPSIFSGRASQELMTNQCDQCHDFFTESTITFTPGPEGFSKKPWKRPITPDQTGDFQFYGDGSHKSPCSMGTVFRSSKMWHAGVRCTECHDPHGTRDWADLKLPTARNELCLSCHGEGGTAERQFPTIEAQTAHSHHAADSPGNLCHECHMPRHMIFTNGQQMMSDRIPKHDFSIPTGVRKPNGPPPSCNVCHTDRDDAWTRAVLKAWRDGTTPPR